MKFIKVFSFFLIGLVAAGTLLVAMPAFAVTSKEIKNISDNLRTDSGMINTATELAGVDSPLVKKFRLGVKYGEFYARLAQGDYWGVATDFVKFELDREVDKLKDMAIKKVLSAGAQRLVVVFTALKDTGIWLGNKALDMQFNTGVKVGYELYKENEGDPAFMEGWWSKYGKAKLEDLGTFNEWMNKFAKVYALEKQLTAAPPTTEDVKSTAKVIKKTAIVDFFKLKYPGIGINVAEELADAIVNNASSAVIEQIAEKYKNHLSALTVAGDKSGVVSTGGICGVIKDEENRKYCEEILAKIIDYRNQVLSNKIIYYDYFRWTNPLAVSYLKGLGDESLTEFKKGQENIIAAAYDSQFGQEIRAVNASLAANKDEFENLKGDYKNIPGEGNHWSTPSFKISVNTGFVRVFNNAYNKVFNYGSFGYEDFKNGVAQKNYQDYLDNEIKANIADGIRARYLKTHLSRANNLLRDLTFLQNRINSLISSAESAKGVFSYGQTTIDDLKGMVSEVEELEKDIKSGEKPWWSFWRQQDGWSIDSTSGAIKGMESDKNTRKSAVDQMKKDYDLAVENYKKEEKQRKLEEQKQAEEEKKAAAEKEAQALKEKKAQEDAIKQERARQEAEKQAAAEKARLAQSAKSYNVPLNKTASPTPTSTPKVVATPAKTATPSPTPSAQPSTQSKSNLPSGYSNIPNEYDEIAGFSFSSQGKVDMMIADFFWNDDGIYTVEGILDMGPNTINTVSSVPVLGYKVDPYQPVVGHVYAIKTRSGKYAIIQVALVEAGHRLYFFWKYQPNGSPSFQ